MANKIMNKNKILNESQTDQTVNDKRVASTDLLGIDIWHPFDGKWVHIVQETATKNKIRKYYTDGKLVETKEININGTIKSL